MSNNQRAVDQSGYHPAYGWTSNDVQVLRSGTLGALALVQYTESGLGKIKSISDDGRVAQTGN